MALKHNHYGPESPAVPFSVQGMPRDKVYGLTEAQQKAQSRPMTNSQGEVFGVMRVMMVGGTIKARGCVAHLSMIKSTPSRVPGHRRRGPKRFDKRNLAHRLRGVHIVAEYDAKMADKVVRQCQRAWLCRDAAEFGRLSHFIRCRYPQQMAKLEAFTLRH